MSEAYRHCFRPSDYQIWRIYGRSRSIKETNCRSLEILPLRAVIAACVILFPVRGPAIKYRFETTWYLQYESQKDLEIEAPLGGLAKACRDTMGLKIFLETVGEQGCRVMPCRTRLLELDVRMYISSTSIMTRRPLWTYWMAMKIVYTVHIRL